MTTLSVRDVITLYLRHSSATGLHCSSSLAERNRILKQFADLHGDKAVEECKAFHLSDWIESHDEWKSVSTRKAKTNMIRAAFSWAADGERIPRNPFAKVRYGEAERRPDMPEEVIDRLAGLANKHFERAVRFLRLTGCRLSELAQAQWEDVDLEKGTWVIHKHKSRKNTKKDKLVALVPEAVSHLREMGQFQEMKGVIFLNSRGTPWTGLNLSKHFARLRERFQLNTKASLHGIRHRFGSASIAAGAPIKLVSQQLGHSSVVITEGYYCDLSGEIDSIRNAISLGIPRKS